MVCVPVVGGMYSVHTVMCNCVHLCWVCWGKNGRGDKEEQAVHQPRLHSHNLVKLEGFRMSKTKITKTTPILSISWKLENILVLSSLTSSATFITIAITDVTWNRLLGYLSHHLGLILTHMLTHRNPLPWPSTQYYPSLPTWNHILKIFTIFDFSHLHIIS